MAPRHPGSIGSLALALFHKWEPKRLFVILTAYLDESGTHDGSPVTIMAGMMANVRQWDRFEREFKYAQRKHKFKIFHTKKFKRRDGDFKGWTNERCLALIADLSKLTQTAFMESVVMRLDNETYENEYKVGERPNKLRLDSKYGLCFRECLYHFLREIIRRMPHGKIERLHIVLENGHRNAGDADRIFYEVKEALKEDKLD